MALKDELKEALRNAAMGDEQAIEALAVFHERQAGQQQQAQQQDQALAQQVNQEWSDRWRFSGKVSAMAKEFPVLDQNSDPEGFAYAAELDAKLKAKHPDWDEDKRLLAVAEKTTAAMGSPEDRDYQDAIATMAGRRLVSSNIDPTNTARAEAKKRAAAKAAEAESSAEDIDAQIERDRSSAIGDMAIHRMGRKVESGKPEDPRRMRRMFEFPQ